MANGPHLRGAVAGERRDELIVLCAFAALASVVAFAFFYRHGDILLYGDAVAHLNLARRLTDARTPGWKQIGTVWLPLPHFFAAPFVANDKLWTSGIGGSIPSMVAYVLGVAGIFRLVRARAGEGAAWLAAAIYGLNPSLLYMQATAMTESIFLAEMVWSVVYLDAFLRALAGDAEAELPAWRALERCGLCLAAAIFTRYDGWILAFLVGVSATIAALGWMLRAREKRATRRLRRSLASFLLLQALCPALWLAHNYRLNQKPLDWLNGPYSAAAIAQRMPGAHTFSYPGKGSVRVAAEYFLEAARMDTGEGRAESWLLWLAAVGLGIAVAQPRRFGAVFVLWFPLPFYAYAIAYGSVPIYVPVWWPYTYYNARYGLELLPAIAASVALLPAAATQIARRSPQKTPRWLAPAVTALLLAAVGAAYVSSAGGSSLPSHRVAWPRRWMIPVCYREAWVNGRGRVAMEKQMASELAELPPGSTVLMYTADHVGALERAGVPLRRVISEFSPLQWEAALSAPSVGADYVVAVAGDPVAEAVRLHPQGLAELAVLHTMGKPPVAIYRSISKVR